MKSTATTVKDYLASLPEEGGRRAAVSTVRRFILDNLDRNIVECMQYGVIGYCVPHTVWPHGHHTNPKLPLMYMGLSSQKNDMVVYMLFLHHNEPERKWFDAAWKDTGKKNYLEVSGGGCCLRFKKLEDLSLDVIAQAMRRVPVQEYLENRIAMLARIGRGPDGKPLKSAAGGSADGARRTAAKKPAAKPAKRARARTTKPKHASSRAR
jgi:hypothetical protein